MEIVKGKLDYEVGECDFTGLTTDSIITDVNNDDRTIKADLNFSTLPKNPDGTLKDGAYILQAEVIDGVITLSWTTGGANSEPCYHGCVTIPSLADLTSQIILDNCEVDKIKIEKSIGKEYSYEALKNRCLFAYPAVYGDLSKIIHVQTGFDVTTSFSKLELTINEATYNVYIQTAYSTGTYTYSYKFIF